MNEIRFHGRGGQGVVIASKILASALAREGKYVQAFPLFGGERRGAPVRAFTRVDDKPILIRSNIYKPDFVVVLDSSLLKAEDVTAGLKTDGQILINTEKGLDELTALGGFRVATVDANKIAQENRLGSRNAPIVNTAILGAFARVSNLVKVNSVLDSLGEYVHQKVIESNRKAIIEAFDQINVLR